jgi:hypothetical protein
MEFAYDHTGNIFMRNLFFNNLNDGAGKIRAWIGLAKGFFVEKIAGSRNKSYRAAETCKKGSPYPVQTVDS